MNASRRGERPRRVARGIAAAAAVALALATTSAYAAEDEAQRLFDEAHALLDAGRVADACARFRQSLALDPAAGTLLNLGVCLVRAGSLVEARSILVEARALAVRDDRAERLELADRYLAEVDRRLAHLEISVRGLTPTTTVDIEIDGRPVPRDIRTVALDPGSHVLRADDARGRVLQIAVNLAEGSTGAVEVDLTGRSARASSPRVGARPAPRPRSVDPWPIVGWGSVGLGVVGAGVGTALGLYAVAADDKADERCGESRCTDAEGASLAAQADSFATASNVSLGVGLGLVAVGTLTLLLAPSRNDNAKVSGRGIALTF